MSGIDLIHSNAANIYFELVKTITYQLMFTIQRIFSIIFWSREFKIFLLQWGTASQKKIIWRVALSRAVNTKGKNKVKNINIVSFGFINFLCQQSWKYLFCDFHMQVLFKTNIQKLYFNANLTFYIFDIASKLFLSKKLISYSDL
jgi:hypothetical protein